MKKTLSVFLAVLMILSCFMLGFSAVAEGDEMNETPVCACADCTRQAGKCHCCVYCPYLDKGYLTSCVQDEDGNFKDSFCCGECTGIWPCKCGCPCCDPDKKDDNNTDPILTPDQQKTFVEIFRSVLKKVSDVFDKLFDAIEKFLRLDDFFGKQTQ